MKDIYDNNSNHNNIFNYIKKKNSGFELLLIIKKIYFTDNIVYYYLCILFRFIPLFLLSGDYSHFFDKNEKSKTFFEYLKLLTCHNIISQLNISINIYILVHIIILSLFIIKILINLYFIINFHNNKYKNKKTFQNKFKIILDHFIFLIFPYIIEYLSFSYYIYLFPNKFIIKVNNKNSICIYLLIVLSTILIIGYNIDNYLGIISSNRMNMISIYDAYLKIYKRKNNKHIAYRISNLELFFLNFLQNFIIILTLDYYLNLKYIMIFKIIISITILLTIIIIIFSSINKYNYTNLINISIYIFIFFCFYSIIIDFIIFLSKYRLNNNLINVIYVLFKLFLSYVTYVLIKLKNKKFLESKITQIFFKEKNKRNEIDYINSLYYLHDIMLKIKDKKDIKFILLLVSFLNKHIIKCENIVCNCQLLKPFIQIEIINKNDIKEHNTYIDKLINILNYLFESIFTELDYYNKYDLVILLSEHFCYLKNNPTMAFSFINTFILKQKGRLSKFQMVNLYELSQKYIFLLEAKIKYEIEKDIKINNKELLIKNIKSEEIIGHYDYLKLSYLIKKILINYIDNEIKILKYKNIFEDSIAFQYDENNENIISAKILFFNQSTIIDNLYNNKHDVHQQKLQNRNENLSNLHIIIFLLKKEYIYHIQLSDYISQIKFNQNLPVFLIFKLCIFLDIINREILSKDLNIKLYNSLGYKSNIYNGDKVSNVYAILMKKYNETNNQINSKHYAIFEYKKELRTKYYCEDCALKLGYKQKDIINKQIDELMPKEFGKSHQNIIKKSIISNQIRSFNFLKKYFFDFTSTVLYPVAHDGILIYNLSNYLNILIEWKFNDDNEYQFMLNNDLELLANTKNFELEYFLNQQIFQKYNIKMTNILRIKPEKISKIFKNEINNSKFQNYIKKFKTEEYFIPKFYAQSGDKNPGINISKNNILSKLVNSLNIEEKENIYDNENNYKIDQLEKEEETKLITKNNQKSITNLFITKEENIIHNTYKMTLNKATFIKNIALELSKIEDHILNYEDENNKYNSNLLMSSKKLISKLLNNKELVNNFLSITIKYSYYYDKSFYFIIIDDQKKLNLNDSDKININNHLIKKKKKDSNTSSSLFIIKKNLIPYNKKDKKSRNIKLSTKKTNSTTSINKIILENDKDDKNIVLSIINSYRLKINKPRFILIIRYILSIFIIVNLIIYILLIIYLEKIIYINDKIILTYFYNIHTKDFILNLYDKLHQVFYDHTNLSTNPIQGVDEYQSDISSYSILLKDYYHNFTSYFYQYNLAIGHSLNIIHEKKIFLKLRGFWQEFEYSSDFLHELDFIIYNFFTINMSKAFTPKSFDDRKYFFFFKDRTDIRMRPVSSMIKLYYYLCTNYEFIYKPLFNEIEQTIHNSYQIYNNLHIVIYYLFEILGILFFIIFFILTIFLLDYYNEIIIKNIIFLFLDFSENYNNNNNTNNIINLKLIELKYLIEDFNLNRFKIFSQNLDNINRNKSIYSLNKEIIENNKNIEDNHKNENKNEQEYKYLNQNDKYKKFTSNQKSKKTINESIKNALNKTNSINKSNKCNDKINNSKDILFESNSQSFKYKLNNNSISASKELLINTNNNKLNNLLKEKISNNNNGKNNSNNMIISLKNKKNEEQKNIQELLLNESKQNKIAIIQIYSLTIFLFGLIIIFFSIYKFIIIIKYKLLFENFFSNYSSITNRYNILYSAFNTFRTLLIYPEVPFKQQFEEIMENLTEYYENETNTYNNIVQNKINDYLELKKLLDILKLNKDDCVDIIKENICLGHPFCLNYLNSNYHIFNSGIDLAFQICIKDLNNLFLDYKKLKNKTDINEINSTIINNPSSSFLHIGLSLSNLFYYTKERIFESFKNDEVNFREKYIMNITLLNLISIILSIISLLFVNIFLFISLYRFSEPIKESTFRINLSFYNIKKYSYSS